MSKMITTLSETFQRIDSKAWLDSCSEGFSYGYYVIDEDQYFEDDELITYERLVRELENNPDAFHVWALIDEGLKIRKYILRYYGDKTDQSITFERFFVIDPGSWWNEPNYILEGAPKKDADLGDSFTFTGWFTIYNMRIGNLYIGMDNFGEDDSNNRHFENAIKECELLRSFQHQVAFDGVGRLQSLKIEDKNEKVIATIDNPADLISFSNWWLRNRIDLKPKGEELKGLRLILGGVDVSFSPGLGDAFMTFHQDLLVEETPEGKLYTLFPYYEPTKKPAVQLWVPTNDKEPCLVCDEFIRNGK